MKLEINYKKKNGKKHKHVETKQHASKNSMARDFPVGSMVKNPPANAGNTGLSPGPGRSHVSQSN